MTNQEQYELICEKAKKYDRLVDVLETINTEIKEAPLASRTGDYMTYTHVVDFKKQVLRIIDKYMQEVYYDRLRIR